MGWLGEILESLINRLSQPYFDDKKRKVLFLSLLGILAVFCILSLFSFEYAGSKNPVDLFQCHHINYSFAGYPVYTHIYTDRLNMSIGSANNTYGSITINGASEMQLLANDITLISSNGTERHVKGPITVYSLPGTSADMSYTVPIDDDFNYIMSLDVNKPAGLMTSRPSVLNITKRSDRQYLITPSLAQGLQKIIRLRHERCALPISISGYFKNIGAGGHEIGDIRQITYRGQINISTDSGLSMKVPASMMVGASGYKIHLDRSEGTLDIRHIEYKTNAADNIHISPQDPDKDFISIVNGQVTASGVAGSLLFREHDFNHPITVVIQEGNFTLLTGLLMSIVTIIAARIITQLKKR